MSDLELNPQQLSSDGDKVIEGCDPPTEEEQLNHLKAKGWPDGEH
jgi:hypothetical protein